MNVDLSTNQRSAPSVPNQRTQRLAPRSGAKSKRFPSRLCSAVRAPGSMKGVFGDEENQLPLDSPDDPPDFDPAAKRRPWSADEDEHLKQLVGEHGIKAQQLRLPSRVSTSAAWRCSRPRSHLC